MNIKLILKGLLTAAAGTVIAVIISAAAGYFFDAGDGAVYIISRVIMCLGVVFSAYGVSSSCDGNKLLNALITGALYFILLVIMSLIMCYGIGSLSSFVFTLICVLISIVLGTFLS